MRSIISPMAIMALFQLFAAPTTSASDFDLDSSFHPAALSKRGEGFGDAYNIYIRKRNAHACMMSIVFIVLFPIAAISLHLPLRGTRVVQFIHAPIQILGTAMMIGAMGLGIDIARNDVHYLGPGSVMKAHVVFGLIITSSLILFQPALGLLQHRHFKKTGRKSAFGHVHRWFGRVAICCGWINSGLGFQLVGLRFVATSSLVREYVLMGLLGGIWFALVGWDGLRSHVQKRDKIGGYALGWKRGPVLKKGEVEGDEKTEG